MTPLVAEDVNSLRRIFLVWKLSKFLAVGLVFFPIPWGFPWKFRGIILGDNPVGHFFVVRNLFPMNFLELAMILLLKIYAAAKIFGKICLKGIRSTFFSNMWSVIKGGTRGNLLFSGGDIQQKRKVHTFGLQGDPFLLS